MHNLLHLAGKKEEEIERIKRKHPGFASILSATDLYSSCFRQPNDQGRVVAPITSFSHIKSISRGEDARLLLIVRHPFDRYPSTRKIFQFFSKNISDLFLHFETNWNSATDPQTVHSAIIGMAYSNRKPFNLFQLLGTTNNTAKTSSLDTARKLSGNSDPDSSQKSKSCL